MTSLRLLLSTRWLVAGLSVGALASAATAIVAALADGAEVSSAARIAAILSPGLLGALVGLTTGSLVRARVGGRFLAVTAALTAVIVGPLVPLGAIPILTGVGALATAERPWVRALAVAALFLAVALLVGVPVAAASREATIAVGWGVAGSLGVGAVVALWLAARVRPLPGPSPLVPGEPG